MTERPRKKTKQERMREREFARKMKAAMEANADEAIIEERKDCDEIAAETIGVVAQRLALRLRQFP